MAKRSTKIDDAILRDHFRLEASDNCFFIREYRTDDPLVAGESRSLLMNLKKKPSQSNQGHYKYKQIAIDTCIAEFSQEINRSAIAEWTFVPIPPSKVLGDSEYDDRMVRVCQGLHGSAPKDVRELVKQRSSTRASHESGADRLTVEDLLNVYYIDEEVAAPPPTKIVIVDDTITAGTHFKAMQSILSTRFPGVFIMGLFWVRRALNRIDAMSDFDDES